MINKRHNFSIVLKFKVYKLKYWNLFKFITFTNQRQRMFQFSRIQWKPRTYYFPDVFDTVHSFSFHLHDTIQISKSVILWRSNILGTDWNEWFFTSRIFQASVFEHFSFLFHTMTNCLSMKQRVLFVREIFELMKHGV